MPELRAQPRPLSNPNVAPRSDDDGGFSAVRRRRGVAEHGVVANTQPAEVSGTGRFVGQPRARTTSVAWLAHTELTSVEWESYGPRIGLMSKGTNWWLGDWVRFGQRRYDRRYRDAAALTGYDEQTLMNLAYVAGRIEISRRREDVSWSHHAELAKLENHDQDEWLDRVLEERLSVRKLRAELRQSRQATVARTAASDESSLAPSDGSVVCPHCGELFVIGEAVPRARRRVDEAPVAPVTR
jgi:hypothetical protein